jgi:hypothetical protein
MGMTPIPTAPQAMGNPQPPSVPAGIGLAGSKTRAVGSFMAALQGLRFGFAQQQVKKYDQVQSQYMLARSQWEASTLQIDNLTKQGVGQQDPRMQAAIAAETQAQESMRETYGELMGMMGGGKKGGKKGESGATGQPGGGNEDTFKKIGSMLQALLLPQRAKLPTQNTWPANVPPPPAAGQ